MSYQAGRSSAVVQKQLGEVPQHTASSFNACDALRSQKECFFSFEHRRLVPTKHHLPFSEETLPLISLSGITLEVSGCLSWSPGRVLVLLTSRSYQRDVRGSVWERLLIWFTVTLTYVIPIFQVLRCIRPTLLQI